MNNQLPNKIEAYSILTTVSDDALANRLCTALEDAGISILMEHAMETKNGERTALYKLLAPPSHNQIANSIVNLHLAGQQTKLLVTSKLEAKF